MRIEFLTQDDSLYILPFFEKFLRSHASEFEILHISCSPMMGKRSRVQMVKELTTLYGPFGLAKLASEVAVSRLFSKFPMKRDAARYYGLAQIAKAYGIAFSKIGNPNAAGFIEAVKHRSTDVLVSVACPYILKDTLLSIPPRGCVNIHHAPLPRFKGMMPTFWQMFHGEKSVGVTVHFMTAKVDEGAVLFQDTMAINPGETLHELIQRSKRHGAGCMARVLHQLESNTQTPKSLDKAKGTYFTFPTIAEIQEFRRRGLRPI